LLGDDNAGKAGKSARPPPQRHRAGDRGYSMEPRIGCEKRVEARCNIGLGVDAADKLNCGHG
jgi:hypothetical protein